MHVANRYDVRSIANHNGAKKNLFRCDSASPVSASFSSFTPTAASCLCRLSCAPLGSRGLLVHLAARASALLTVPWALRVSWLQPLYPLPAVHTSLEPVVSQVHPGAGRGLAACLSDQAVPVPLPSKHSQPCHSFRGLGCLLLLALRLAFLLALASESLRWGGGVVLTVVAGEPSIPLA